MLSPRWSKVFRDLWSNKTRTILVVISIAVGVFAIGAVNGARVILNRDLTNTWNGAIPPSATLFTENFDDDLVQVIRKMPEVGDAEARRAIGVRVRLGPDQWKELTIYAIPDFDDMRINIVNRTSGAWPPDQRELLLERATLPFFGIAEGDSIVIETPDNKLHTLRVSGVVHDPGQFPTSMAQRGYGYISLDTAVWLGQPRDFNQLNIVVAEDPLNKTHIEAVSRLVEQKIEKGGREVFGTNILDPGKYPADSFVQAILLLLTVVGFFALMLSGFLVVNTIGALLQQQVKQIGMMKSIGARRMAIVSMYLVTVLFFGLMALLIAVPLGVLGAWGLSSFFAGMFNFDITTVSVPPDVLVLQVATGLLVPLLAALAPVITGTRITVREAISSYGLGKGRFGRGRIDQLLEQVRFLSRPMLLSLRNTFRRKGRLALTLITLTMAGVIFMAVMSVQASLNLTIDNIFAYYRNDIWITMGQSYRTAVLDDAARVPGVTAIEHWNGYSSRRLVEGNREGTNTFDVVSLPAQTRIFNPALSEGRWLLPDDQGAVVVNTEFLKKERDVKIGDRVRFKVGNQEVTLQVVGVVDILFANPTLYVNQPAFDRVMGNVGRAGQIQIVTDHHDGAYQNQIATQIEERMKQQGLEVVSTLTNTTLRTNSSVGINIVIAFLYMMAVLLTFVGGLGLMGTMSINVLERTREIGVLRAIGAADGAVQRIVVVEGVLIGAISWLIGALLAFPTSKLMNDALAVAFEAPGISFTFSFVGVLLWLAIVTVLAAVASFLPAWNASRVTVRDVLAYE